MLFVPIIGFLGVLYLPCDRGRSFSFFLFAPGLDQGHRSLYRADPANFYVPLYQQVLLLAEVAAGALEQVVPLPDALVQLMVLILLPENMPGLQSEK